jgi:hypothetical protein
VLKCNEFYYLWVSGTDYAVMSVYVSQSPYDFGDAELNQVMEQPGHAAEIVFADNRYWMACCAIASQPGFSRGPLGDLPSAYHDLPGIYIQPLEWVILDSGQRSRIVPK